MTKQKMQLPLTCEKHVHDGYGTSKDVPCPWCEIELLRSRLAAALSFVPDDVTFSELRAAAEPTAKPLEIGDSVTYAPRYESQLPREGWIIDRLPPEPVYIVKHPSGSAIAVAASEIMRSAMNRGAEP